MKYCCYCGNKLVEGLCPICQPTTMTRKTRWTYECKKCQLIIHQGYVHQESMTCKHCGLVIKPIGEEITVEVLKSSVRG